MAQKESFALIIIVSLAATISSAAVSKKFPPISGEVHGQAVTGVKSITVNGKPVPIDEKQHFRTRVSLKEGEKYLTLIINYNGFKIVKKYLILRRPQVKEFKVYVPREKIVLPKTRPARKGRAEKRPTPIRLKACEYKYVWEFSRGKLMLVKETRGLYSADILILSTDEWLELKRLSRQELKNIITK